ncbi:MAG: O-methyltransferase [Geodermatophilaceae bacterium]|nr:O-methyltransferase [Geodermatophilaceae bacterium]MDQ3463623.1 O-methyltransferase [Actinomycetota bacterium]
MGSSASREYAESFGAEDQALVAARARSEEFGCEPVTAAAGNALRFLAATLDARAVVEVGTGAGVSGLWLLAGMRADGILTSVDTEAEHQRAARQSFREADIAPTRTRLINGAALQVLPRLTDAAYDLVFIDGPKSQYLDCLAEALRLLRHGGVVVFAGVLGRGRVGEATARDPETVALRELTKTVRDHEQLVPTLLPLGDGLLAALHRP